LNKDFLKIGGMALTLEAIGESVSLTPILRRRETVCGVRLTGRGLPRYVVRAIFRAGVAVDNVISIPQSFPTADRGTVPPA